MNLPVKTIMLALALAACQAVAAPAWAHEEGQGHQAAASVTGQAEAEATVNYIQSLGSHIHNKVVHFPVALGLTSLLFALLCLRWPVFLPSLRLLLGLAVLGALLALLTGPPQAKEFVHGPLRGILHRHIILGRLSTGGLVLGFLLSWLPGSPRWIWIYLILVAGLISAAGFLGGILAAS